MKQSSDEMRVDMIAYKIDNLERDLHDRYVPHEQFEVLKKLVYGFTVVFVLIIMSTLVSLLLQPGWMNAVRRYFE